MLLKKNYETSQNEYEKKDDTIFSISSLSEDSSLEDLLLLEKKNNTIRKNDSSTLLPDTSELVSKHELIILKEAILPICPIQPILPEPILVICPIEPPICILPPEPILPVCPILPILPEPILVICPIEPPICILPPEPILPVCPISPILPEPILVICPIEPPICILPEPILPVCPIEPVLPEPILVICPIEPEIIICEFDKLADSSTYTQSTHEVSFNEIISDETQLDISIMIDNFVKENNIENKQKTIEISEMKIDNQNTENTLLSHIPNYGNLFNDDEDVSVI
jgi:hypothetical protein